MPQRMWTLGDLTEEQERMLKEAEASMGGDILLAYQQAPAEPADLTPEQLRQVEELEKKLGMVVVALRRP